MSKVKSLPDTSSPVNTRMWLSAIALLYLVFAIAYNLVTPAGTPIQHNPDENGHMLYIQTLASGHLPVFTTAAAGPEFHQPPLYYLIALPVYAATRGMGDAGAMHAVRFVSTVLGLFLILAAYRCARRLFPDEPWVALLTAGIVGLLPMNVAMNASVGNDALTNLLVALGLMLLAKIATQPGAMPRAQDGHDDAGSAVDPKSTILLGVILGLIILTKSSALVLYPAVFVAFALLAYRKALTPQVAVRSAAIAIVLGLLIGSPWLIRNTMLYGDPLGQKLFLKSFQGTTASADMIIQLVHGFGAYTALITKWTFASFWGVFDSMTAFWGRDPHPVLSRVPPHAPMPPPFDEPLSIIYNAFAVLTGIALVGAFIDLRRRQQTPSQNAVLWSFLVLILATAYGFAMFTMQFFQAQGRYWFTSLVPLALFFALGYRGIFARASWYRAVSIALIVALALLNAYTVWGLLVPRFSAG